MHPAFPPAFREAARALLLVIRRLTPSLPENWHSVLSLRILSFASEPLLAWVPELRRFSSARTQPWTARGAPGKAVRFTLGGKQ